MTNYQIILSACTDAMQNINAVDDGLVKYKPQREAYEGHFRHVARNCEALIDRTGGNCYAADKTERRALNMAWVVVNRAAKRYGREVAET
jgi:hypothetical protein